MGFISPLSDNPCNLNRNDFICRYWWEISAVIIILISLIVIGCCHYFCKRKLQRTKNSLDNSDGTKLNPSGDELDLDNSDAPELNSCGDESKDFKRSGFLCKWNRVHQYKTKMQELLNIKTENERT